MLAAALALGLLAAVLERRRRLARKQVHDFMEWESYPH
jgi:hypothetical protein